MSVLVSKRQHSEVQFLENARQLELYTFRKTIKMPKRWNHFKTILENCVIQCYNNCKLGNSIFLKDLQSAEQRKEYFEKALQNLYVLSCQIDIAKELNLCEKFTDKQFAHWIGLISNEIEQLKYIEKSDFERIK